MNRRSRTNLPGHKFYRKNRCSWRKVRLVPIKRRLVSPTGPTAAGVPVGGDFYERYPNLHEFLSEDHYEDGSSRVTGTVLLFADGSVAKCLLSDRDNSTQCWLTAKSFGDALELAEEALYTGNAEWRQAKPPARKKT